MRCRLWGPPGSGCTAQTYMICSPPWSPGEVMDGELMQRVVAGVRAVCGKRSKTALGASSLSDPASCCSCCVLTSSGSPWHMATKVWAVGRRGDGDVMAHAGHAVQPRAHLLDGHVALLGALVHQAHSLRQPATCWYTQAGKRASVTRCRWCCPQSRASEHTAAESGRSKERHQGPSLGPGTGPPTPSSREACPARRPPP